MNFSGKDQLSAFFANNDHNDGSMNLLDIKKCSNKQATISSRIKTLAKSGFTVENVTGGIVISKHSSPTRVTAASVEKLVMSCLGEQCELVESPDNPIWGLKDLGNNKFLLEFNKGIL